jgi:2-oxoglutarate ferredoxin oxidoreductase subunit delta
MPEVVQQVHSPAPVPSKAEGPAKKGPRGVVFIHATWCKGCRICVEFCPPKVLAMDENEDHPRIVAPEKCTACHFCDTHCPDLAIVVRKLE